MEFQKSSFLGCLRRSKISSASGGLLTQGGGRKGIALRLYEVTGKLKQRVSPQLAGRDSSVTIGASMGVLRPEYINETRWWEHIGFTKSHVVEAGELVASDALKLIL
jgi:hypothetical protein